MIYGYSRGSNGTIDLKNQRARIAEYCKDIDKAITFIDDTVSSGKPMAERKISKIVDNLVKDDMLVVAELSRMARNTEEVLAIGRLVIQKGASLAILNPKIDFDGGLSSEILLTVLGMASNIERYYIRSRTRQALKLRKQEIIKKGYFTSNAGKKIRHLGTPAGSSKTLKLEAQLESIHKLVGLGVTHASIGKIHNVSRHTVSRFLQRFPFVKET